MRLFMDFVEGLKYNLMQEERQVEQTKNQLIEGHLPPRLPSQRLQSHEDEEGEEEEEEEEEMVSWCSLFRFATATDALLIVLGTICAAATGVAMPIFSILWGDMTNSFGNASDTQNAAKRIMLNFLYIGLGAFAAGWGMFACWMISGERQGIACRKAYLRSLLRQEIGWFDTINQSELATKFATDCFAFQGAIGEKVSTVIMTIAMFIAGFVIAFVYGWLMTLVVLASLPAIAIGGGIYASTTAQKDQDQEKDYAEAGGLVEQAISGIKTIKQMNGEEFEAKKYSQSLKGVTKNSAKYGALLGLGMGLLMFAMLASYALGFWFGSKCVEGSSSCLNGNAGDTKYTAGDVLIVFFSVLMAGFQLSQMSPAVQKITEGITAGTRIFKVLDREPLVKSPENGQTPEFFRGEFKFDGVSFAYPKDKSKKILNNLNLEINSKFSAFVGESGCGKSTIFQLIMRFYDPDEGKITLDGVDLKELDLNWLRRQIGYVGQEPVLFATTLRENLLFGNQNATDEEIMMALKQAEALDFVEELKDKLDTYVGTGGGQISGGQKQRIAIARALLKNPKILLLDQATSALDRRNERLIQGTLNKIAEEKTTLTIAHRVKTIMNCEHIMVMDKGVLAEQGRFKDLKRYKNVDLQHLEQEEVQSILKSPVKLPPVQIKVKPADQQQAEAKAEETKREQNKGEGEPVEGGKEEEELSEESKKKKEEEALVEKYEDSVFTRLFAYASDDKCLFFLGILFAIANGGVFPAFSIFLSKMLAVLINFGNDPVKAREDANLYALVFFIISLGALVFQLLVELIFTYIGENITEKVRNETYHKILKMPIPWFDKEKNSSGSLSARLASDCKAVKGIVTTYIYVSITSVTTLIAGVVIALIYEWRTSLVALGLLPLIVISGVIQMAFTDGFSDKTDKVYKQSSNLITESMNAIRTVTSFGSEGIIERKYDSKLEVPMEAGVSKGIIAGLMFGISQLILFVIFGLIFYLGVIFMIRNNLDISDIFTAIYAIVFSGMTAGNNAHFMPDVAAGKKAAASIFQIQDSKDEDQLQEESGSRRLTTKIEGEISFRNVSFKYESRDDQVFTDLSFNIKEGQKIGLVGPSGCGKSTVQQMLQRFYDPDQGQILLDGVNLKDFDIHHLRASLGVVSQEPTLFNCTIAQNIQYNREGTTRGQIIEAADQSNFNPQKEAIEAVDPSPEKKKKKKKKKKAGEDSEEEEGLSSRKKDGTGFEKNVGVKGSHISGGQKQRVAIARVVLRKPHLLLLDEATSALDSSNEQKVQESLDRMMKNRTTLSVAHRLDTIKNSDQILVFHKGGIVERGAFGELMSKKGYFYNLEKGLEFV